MNAVHCGIQMALYDEINMKDGELIKSNKEG